MDNTFTLKDYLRIKLDEEELFGSNEDTLCQAPVHEPSQQTISNILNYSKALSVRKSKYTEFITSVLN
ncbi:MAG TPA: hypothetical protein EYN69_05995 [Flavobacteriales bacterium]|nr:hypothetical protein [Flavobacteriales bacterium]